MLNSMINLVEKGVIPDFLVRKGIVALCKQRLREEGFFDCETQSKRYREFLEELKSTQIAINTDKANEQHYEVPASFYLKSLGANLKYSSCYWDENITNLDEAEVRMLELYCKRGEFENGQNILELGCGWGSLTLFLASKYPDSRITAISNSSSQKKYIDEQAVKRGLNNVRIITQDINQFDIEQTFDRIVSIEMFEHIRNYEQLFNKVASWLTPKGKLFVHIFCHQNLMYPFEEDGDDNWMGRYFFSGGQMPAADTFLHFQESIKIENRWLLSGTHYEKTSNAWLKNMDRHKKAIISEFKSVYGAENADKWFYRWRVFFMSCAELFGYDDGNQWLVAHYLFSKK